MRTGRQKSKTKTQIKKNTEKKEKKRRRKKKLERATSSATITFVIIVSDKKLVRDDYKQTGAATRLS